MRRIVSAEQHYVNEIPINFIGFKENLPISGDQGSYSDCYPPPLASFRSGSTTPRLMARL